MTFSLTPESQVDLAAMARIVQDLLAGGEERLHDGRWLHARAADDGVGTHACAALEALRQRLCERGAALVDATAILHWG